ncbi:efflux RND transporter periplasmic adaptor subunit [Albidovulum sp.]|uniref:efflux RND transporter periplasmic adaptor subunit n=1 Tax=Albidovulum sp. TaxID=1872424 RepID=UPI0039B8B8A3
MSLLTILAPVAALAQQPMPEVAVMTAEATDYTATVRLPGRVKASTIAEVRPQVSGIIQERLFEEGEPVEAGAPLYQIESATYSAAVAAAEAAVAEAQANYDLAVVEAERANSLFSNSTGSAANRDKTVAAQRSADAALQIARAKLTTAEIDLDRTTVRAPVAGVIGFSQTTTGALVGAQQVTTLTTIRTLDPIYVDVTLSANDLLDWNATSERREAMKHASATMILPNRQLYEAKGEIKAAEPRVEPTTGMVTLRVSFPNPQHDLLPGLYVEVELPTSVTKGAVLVPQNAVMRDASGGASVWIVENGKIAVRQLSVLTADGNRWVTTGGLKGGETVVVSGFQKAAPGAEVQIVTDEQNPETAPVGSN